MTGPRTPEEHAAHLHAQGARMDAFIPPKPDRALIRTHAREILIVLSKLHHLGLIPYASPLKALEHMDPEILSYALTVVQRDQEEDAQAGEFETSLFVTRTLALLAQADQLEEIFGHRPVTYAELDALTEIHAAALEEDTTPH